MSAARAGGRRRALPALGLTALILTLGGGAGGAQPEEAGSFGGDAMVQTPVVLELFTSQGCSSCPSADRLLSRLASSPRWQGRVVALAFHVDYWNYIGWTDPFSSAAWSRRQRAYARSLEASTVYTPQLVVGGAADCVGSDAGCIERALAAAAAQPPSWRLSLTPPSSAGTAGDGSLAVQLRAEPLGGSADRQPDLFVALVESGLVTAVGRGENARRTLANDYVVRRLERVSPPPGPAGSEVRLALEPGWDRDRLGVAAFAQDPRTLRILGAALAPGRGGSRGGEGRALQRYPP